MIICVHLNGGLDTRAHTRTDNSKDTKLNIKTNKEIKKTKNHNKEKHCNSAGQRI